MKTQTCKKCPKRTACADPDICPRVGPVLYRVEHGDMRLKKNKHKINLIFESDMNDTELMAWNNGIYGTYEED